MRHAEDFFGALGRGYTIKVRTGEDDLRAACEAAGLKPFGEPGPEMICHEPVSTTMPDGFEIVSISKVEDVESFGNVCAAAYATYGLPEDECVKSFSNQRALLDSPNMWGMLRVP